MASLKCLQSLQPYRLVYRHAHCIPYALPKRFCSSSSSDSKAASASAAQSREDQLKASFTSKFSRKIQSSSTPEAWNRYETEIAGKPRYAQDAFHENFADPE